MEFIQKKAPTGWDRKRWHAATGLARALLNGRPIASRRGAEGGWRICSIYHPLTQDASSKERFIDFIGIPY